MTRRRQPAKNGDLHGSAPDQARAALLLIDVINDLGFEGGAGLTTESCVLVTAADAHMRDFHIADVSPSTRLDLKTLVAHGYPQYPRQSTAAIGNTG